jgi:hypothetical protein
MNDTAAIMPSRPRIENRKMAFGEDGGKFSFDGFSGAGYSSRSLLNRNGLMFASCIGREFEGA